MKKLRKPLSIILTLLMLLSVFAAAPMSADAKDTGKAKTGGGISKSISLNSNDGEIRVYEWSENYSDLIKGVSLDEETKTLTLDNVDFSDSFLIISLWGKDFNLNIVGKCYLHGIIASNTCLNIIGEGSLFIDSNPKHCAIRLSPYDDIYDSALTVADTVNLSVKSAENAVIIESTTVDDVSAVVSGKFSGEFTKTEHPDKETIYINGFCLVDYKDTLYNEVESLYLVRDDDEPNDTMVAAAFKDGGYEARKYYFDNDSGYYFIDDSYSLTSTGDIENSGLEILEDPDNIREKIKVTEYRSGSEYKDSKGNTYIISDKNVFSFTEDKILYHDYYDCDDVDVHQGYILTKTEDVKPEDLELVEYSIYDYTYNSPTLFCSNGVRGAFPSIYLDGDTEHTIYNAAGSEPEALDGISYDEEKNTLTISNTSAYKDSNLVIYDMGADFKIKVVGICELGHIEVHDGGLKLAGTGRLIVDSKEDYAVSIKLDSSIFGNSKFIIGNETQYRLKGAVSAFNITNSSLAEAEVTNIEDSSCISKSGENHTQESQIINGAVLESWDAGFGTKYMVRNENDPDAVYCANYSSTTYMDAWGRPSYTVANYDLRKCVYNETLGKYIITAYIGPRDGGEFNDEGYYMVMRNDSPVRMNCYEMEEIKAKKYTDPLGNTYGVNGTRVYTYSEDDVFANTDGSEFYVFEKSDAEADTLTPYLVDLYSYDYTYNSTEFVREGEDPATEPATEQQAQGDTSAPIDATEADSTSSPTTPEQTDNPSVTVPETPETTVPGEDTTTAPPATGAQDTTSPAATTPTSANPVENPTTPDTQIINYLPDKSLLGKSDNIKLIVQDTAGNITDYNMTETLMSYDGVPVYTAKIPADLNVYMAQFKYYNNEELRGQFNVSKSSLDAAKGKIITSDGSVYNEAKNNTAPTTKTVTPAKKTKAANPIKVTAKKKTVKAKKLKKGKVTLKNAVTVKNAKGKLTYKLKSVSKKLKKLVKINNKGVITIKKWKKAKKGNYKIKVNITASGDANYNPATKTATVKLKIK